MLFLIKALFLTAVAAPIVLAQSTCSGQQYNNLLGFPASNSGCYPLNYYRTSDLGVTSPTDATSRCQQQCTADSQCGSVVAQVNKAADSNNYSGTCFFYNSANTPTGPRSCANPAYLLLGYQKDNTLGCFSSSTAAASSFCSSYLSIPAVTITSTSTPPIVSTTTTITTRPVSFVTTTGTTTPTTTATATTTITVTVSTSTASMTTTTTVTATATSTVTATNTVTVTPAQKRVKRATVPAPACVTSGTPATRLSAACSCLSVKTSTTTTTRTLIPVTTIFTATSTVPTTTTVSATVTAPAITTTATETATSSATATTTATVTATATITTTTLTTTTTTTTTTATQPAPAKCTASRFSPSGSCYATSPGAVCGCTYSYDQSTQYCQNYQSSYADCSTGGSCDTSATCPPGTFCASAGCDQQPGGRTCVAYTGCGSTSPSRLFVRGISRNRL